MYAACFKNTVKKEKNKAKKNAEAN